MLQGCTLGHCVLEAVEVDHEHVDGLDALLFHGGHVVGIVPDGEHAAVDLGVQGFEPAVHHLRESGVVGDVDDRDAAVSEDLGGSSRGDDLDAECSQLFYEINESPLIRDADQCPFNFRHKNSFPYDVFKRVTGC